MKHILLLSWLCILPMQANEILVGSTHLTIPAPGGYSPITSEMQPYADFAKQFVPPSNEQLALYLTVQDAAAASRGEMPQPQRWFYVQVARSMASPFVSTSDFAHLKQMLKAQNDKALKDAELEFPGLCDRLTKNLSDDYDIDLHLSLDQMLPLPPHYETERCLAYSTLVKYKVNDQDGEPTVFEGVSTFTCVHLQGKILFLYAQAESSALDWCRSESKKWVGAVIAANPSTGDIAARERNPPRASFDWSKVSAQAIAGALVAAAFWAISYVFRRVKG